MRKKIKAYFQSTIIKLGLIMRFCLQILEGIRDIPKNWVEIKRQMSRIGVDSLLMVSITGLFTGLTLVVQVGGEFKKMGAVTYMGGIVALALARELGPVLTALVVAGRNGSAMAAEIGTMSVTEQIDALRSMAVNPLVHLGMPRLVACALMLPLLTMYSTIVGIVGGAMVAKYQIGVTNQVFFESILQNTGLDDMCTGLIKALCFGIIIAFSGCFKGFHVRGGADEVGKATTGAVVVATFCILISNYFLAVLASWAFK